MNSRFAISNKTDTAVIDIDGEIGYSYDYDPDKGFYIKDDNSKAGIKRQLKEIAALKASVITINIDSLGGDLFTAISIHDILAEHPAKKIVNIYGMTASAATIIAMAGDTIRMSDNALLLVHRASTFAMGNRNDMALALDDLDNYDLRIANIYAKRTGKSIDFHTAQMNANNGQGEWLTPEEAKAAGYVDEIFEPETKRIAASVSEIQAAKLPIPKLMEDNTMDEVKNMIQALKDWMQETFGAKPENKAFDTKVAEIETKFRELDVASQEAQNAVKDITTERDALKTDVDTVTADRDALKTQVTDLEAQVAQLTAAGVEVINDKDPDVTGVKGKEHPFDAAAKDMKKSIPFI